MKTRVTVTLDPTVIRNAKTIARLKQTNLSALIEDLLKRTASQSTTRRASFSRKWAGKLSVRETANDELLTAMKARYERP